MGDPLVYLGILAGLFLLGALGEIIFAKTQIPDVVWLIAAGVVLRTTGLIDPTQLEPILPLFAALTLIIVLFDGGSQLVIKQLIKAAPRASLLALLGFVLTTLAVAGLTMLAGLSGLLEDWTFPKGLMVGAMLGGSSSLIIMPSMNLAKVEGRVSNLVGLESAFTDSLCVVVAVAMIDIIMSGHASAGGSAIVLAKSFGLGVAIGGVSGWAWMPVLRLMRGNTHAYPVTIAALIFLYVAVDYFEGSAAMAILTFAVIVGNADALMKKVGFSAGHEPLKLDETVRTVHSQISFIIKSFFFTYIGLMLGPPFSLLFLGLVIGIGLLIARIPVVMLVARGKGFTPAHRKMISISLPRGMAAGVLATIPTMVGMEGMEGLPTLVFSAVVMSIVIFAVGFKKVRGETPAPAEGQADEEGSESSDGEAAADGAQAPARAGEAADPNAVAAAGDAPMEPREHVPTLPQPHVPTAVVPPAAPAPDPDGQAAPAALPPTQPQAPAQDYDAQAHPFPPQPTQAPVSPPSGVEPQPTHPASQPYPQAPAQPVAPQPSQPYPQAPAQPIAPQPSQPYPQAPAQPVVPQPSQPYPQAPAKPVVPQPSQPYPQAPAPAQPHPQAPVQPAAPQPSAPVAPAQPYADPAATPPVDPNAPAPSPGGTFPTGQVPDGGWNQGGSDGSS